MNPASVSFPALGTTALLWVTEAEALPAAHAILDEELEAIDKACSRFRADSELSRLNAAGAGRVGSRLFEAVETALRAAATTEGLVDPTLGGALRSLGYDRTFRLVRANSFHVSTAPRVPWVEIELDARRRTVRLPPGSELDLGATAKALAADRAAVRAAEQTAAGVLVSLGGDIAVGGDPPPDGWPIRIADDHAAPLDAPGPTVAIHSGGVASSSTTVRCWRAGEIELHHIVDPRTGLPAATLWRTVSVAAATCVDANVASTAAVVLGIGAPDWLAERSLPARLVGRNGDVQYVAGWPEDAP